MAPLKAGKLNAPCPARSHHESACGTRAFTWLCHKGAKGKPQSSRRPAMHGPRRCLGYTATTMHRWLIAIFALHFVLNVSAFSLGEVPRATEQARWIAASSSAPAAESCGDARTSTSASLQFTHGLMDDLPDLPDTLPRLVSVLRQPVEPGRAIQYLAVHRVPPSLDTPLRPPRTPGA